MKLKLKENPREWQKFAAVLCVLLGMASYVAFRKGLLPRPGLAGVAALIGAILVSSWCFPRAYRGVYRTGMTISFQVGQVMGKVILTALFLLVITPLGWVLRCLGKDLLQLRRQPTATTYWQPARDGRNFEKMF